MQMWKTDRRLLVCGLRLAAALAWGAAASQADEAPAPLPAAAADPATAVAPSAQHAPLRTPVPRRHLPRSAEAVLAARVHLLAAELALDATQQRQVHDLLVQQKEAVRRVWSDASLTEGERGPITSLIGERTADGIRDLLTPAQREKYNPPRPSTKRTPEETQQDLSKWLDAMHKK
jgi:hypothetical protein